MNIDKLRDLYIKYESELVTSKDILKDYLAIYGILSLANESKDMTSQLALTKTVIEGELKDD